MHNLVIITCIKDRLHFALQCKSFNKFLEPCNIFITINERETEKWIEWFNVYCKKYLDKFKYTIHTRQDFNLPNFGQDGYADQQAIKLLYSEILPNSTYCVFDSKNWLIKPMSITEVPISIRNDNLSIKKTFNKFFVECVKLFGEYKVRNIDTPYILDSNIVYAMFNYFGNRTTFFEWFFNTDIKHPSEFLVYDMFAQFSNIADMSEGSPPIHKTFWPREIITDNDIDSVFTTDIKILGIHRLLLPQINIRKLLYFYEI